MSSSKKEDSNASPKASCENCLHREVCVALGRLVLWMNQFMVFFQTMNLPEGMNPVAFTELQVTIADSCLKYREDKDVLSKEE